MERRDLTLLFQEAFPPSEIVLLVLKFMSSIAYYPPYEIGIMQFLPLRIVEGNLFLS